jgi:hypothetical protein
MRRLDLINTAITHSSAPKDFSLSYRTEFLRVLEIIPEGITATNMVALLDVIRKLQDAKETSTVWLEEAEWTTLRDRVKEARFTIVAPQIVEMCNAVVNAPKVETAKA